MINLLDHTSAGSSDSNSVTTTPISTLGASLITICVVSYRGSAEPVLTDSIGNITFSAAGVLRQTSAEGQVHIFQWVVTNANQTSATHTFTATQTSSFASIFVQAWSGTKVASPFDQTSGTFNDSANTLQPGSITPTEDNELIITVVCTNDFSTAFSINGGFTTQDEIHYAIGQHYGGCMAYLIQGVPLAAANPTWDTNGVVGDVLAISISSFKSEPTSSAILMGQSLQ